MLVVIRYFILGLIFISFVTDLAVTVKDQIKLLKANGSTAGIAVQQFSSLKALTFDSVRHQFIMSDKDQSNHTIYSVKLTKETIITPIVEDLPDDVQVS